MAETDDFERPFANRELHTDELEEARLQRNVESIEKELAIVDQRLLEIRKRRKVLQTTLAGEKQKRREATARADVVRSSRMAPMQRIPDEILSLIFEWTDTQLGEAFYGRHFSNLVPWSHHCGASFDLTLLHVSKRWRDVVMTTPSLWTEVKLCIYKAGSDDRISRYRAWLSRSRACLLDLSVYIKSPSCVLYKLFTHPPEDILMYHPVMHYYAETVVRILLPHIQRCKTIDLSLPPGYTNRLLTPQTSELSHLHFLSIQLGQLDYRSHEPAILDFSAFPQLATLVCQSNLEPKEKLVFRGVGRAVRVVSMIMLVPSMIRLLKCCPLVSKCTIIAPNLLDFRGGTETHTQDEIVELSHLTSLEIEQDAILPDVERLFDRLRLPALQELNLDIMGDEPIELWPHLTDLLQRSRPPITELRIDRFLFLETNLIQALSYAPCLRKLVLDEMLVGEAFWQALTMKEESLVETTVPSDGLVHNLCPQLKELKIGRWYPGFGGYPRGEDVAQMVLSRYSRRDGSALRCQPLTMLRIPGGGIADFHDYPGIDNCVKMGFQTKYY